MKKRLNKKRSNKKMIDWIDADEKLPEKSGGYLVWYGNEKSDVYTGSAQIYYSVVHGLWNCHDFSQDKSNAITGIKYWAKINTPYDCKKKNRTNVKKTT